MDYVLIPSAFVGSLWQVCDVLCAVVCRPEMSGTAPSTRFRHTISPISPSPGSSLEVQVIDALGSVKRVEDGDLLFCFGGYNTIGEEFGANSQFVSPSFCTFQHDSCCCALFHVAELCFGPPM